MLTEGKIRKTLKNTGVVLLAVLVLLAMTPAGAMQVDAAAKKPTIAKKVSVPLSGKKVVKIKKNGYKITKVRVKSSNKKVARVKASKSKVTIYGVKAGKAKITVSVKAKKGKKTRTFKLKTIARVKKPANGNAKSYTRGEWVAELSSRLGFNTSGEVDPERYYFGDTTDDPYGLEAELAQAYGILPASDNEGYEDPEQDVPLFESEKPVSREYATYTVVKALGYVEDQNQNLDCWDQENLRYPIQDATGVNQGLIKLQSGYFNPDDALSGAAAKKMLDKLDEIMASADLSGIKPVEDITYRDDVIQEEQIGTEDFTLRETSRGYSVKIRSNEVTGDLRDGDIIVLPAHDDQISDVAMQVSGTPRTSGEYVTLTGTKPELADVVDNITFAGEGTPVIGQFDAASGVTAEYEDSGAKGSSGNANKGINVGGTYNPHGKLKLSFDKPLSNKGTLEGDIEFSVPSVTCKVNADVGFTGVDFKEITLSETDRIEFTGKVEMTAASYKEYVTHASGEKEEVSSSMELGRLPIALGSTGLSIDIILIATYSVKGELSLGYTMELTHGVQVKNNAFRNINDFNQSFDDIKLKGSAKCGVGVRVVLNAFRLMDLAGVETTVGPAAEVEFVPHVAEGLYCGDGRIYVYWDAGVSEETALGKFMKNVYHASIEWEIFNSENSPVNFGAHFENFRMVDKCTYGTGEIIGHVKDSYGNPVKARVEIYSGSVLRAALGTDTEGKYTMGDLAEADYTINVYVTGYSAFTSVEHVGRNETKYVETVVMLSRDGQNGSGEVTGEIIDAVTGYTVDDVKYYIRRDWNNTTGSPVDSGTADGGYQVTLVPGYYTIQFVASGYSDAEYNFTVNDGGMEYVNAALSPEQNLPDDGLLRVVLSWGEDPSDLDSHLTGATLTGDDRYHIYFEDKYYYDEDGTLLADLDLDDTSSYGPETVTIHQLTNGTMHYFVHDYSNRWDSETEEMSLSNAQVRVYRGKSLIKKFVVPTNVEGTYWHVFDIDSAGNIIPVNRMDYEEAE